jgi:hypothetical protein
MARRPGILATVLVAAVVLAAGRAAAQADAACGVRYVSAEHVYLDAGRLAGLEVGAAVRVVRDGTEIAELAVVHVADHSASCRVVTVTEDVVPGDRAFFTSVRPATATIDTTAGPARTRALRPPAERTRRAAPPGPRLSGSVALRMERLDETGDVGLASTVWTLPFRLRVRELGRGWELRARGNLRRYLRDGYGPAITDREWRNRIYEIAMVRDGRREDWHFAFGRITTRATAAAGVFDGLAVNRRVGGTVRVGAFGGLAPAWQDFGFGSDDRLFGLTMAYAGGGAFGRNLNLNLAGVGRYHGGEISREYLALTTTWHGGGSLSLLQAAEVDLNRGWRHDAGESSLDLSSFALGGRWRAQRWFALRAGWDDRRPVRTWETRDRPDSLFQDAGRQGLNAGLELRGDRGRRLYLDVGTRSPAGGGADSRSWSVRGRLPRWPVADLDLDLAVRGFDGPYLAGLAPSANLAWRGSERWYVRAAGGFTSYEDQTGDDARDATWLSAAVEHRFDRWWSAQAELRGDWGEARRGRSLLLELRRRF